MLTSFEGIRPGTRLLVRHDLREDMYPQPQYGVTREMELLAGQVVTVATIEDDDCILLSEIGYNWSPEMFDSVDKEFKDIPLALYLIGGE